MSLLNPRTGQNRWWIIPIIALVAIGTGVLVALAIAPHDPPESELIPWTPPPAATPTASPTAGAEVNTAVPQQRFLAAIDGTTAWRVDAGACPSSQTWPELTTNGGGSWARTDATTGTGASGVLALGAISAEVSGMLTFNAETCGSPQFTSLVDGVWAPVSNLSNEALWYVVPGAGPVVGLGAVSVATPCEPVGVATRSASELAVLCNDERIVRSVDGGVTWDDGFAVAGASVVASTADGYIVGGLNQSRCAGVELRTLTPQASNGDGIAVGCYEAAATPGLVAISSTPNALWVWAGTSLGISPDGGESW
ncbi:hypothetical protein M2152_002044 [Microbacteriaceae bacterium SG_E_30_P1]|uniref:Exo-alpha-sialidase n=1 Tax=Antiquaquibacter oligotrophicus TaxID=2880260 RepID=A0ABT6KRN5_9MICO|nr:hypothetical protein [Antiquaquibacter oligotrophicus]MDH6181862.1 hypothetical protein [Antiquaquibacter oligotrophicus]UDF12461.1 hypothetical protein LH407_09875 [Antiquaquibacter oligotrophicus]